MFIICGKDRKKFEYPSPNPGNKKENYCLCFLLKKKSVLKQRNNPTKSRNNPTKSRNNPTKLDFIFLKQRIVFFILFSNSAIMKPACFGFDFVSLQFDFAETDIRIHLSDTKCK